MFPIEAAVMPLPREETTPPVTKTYFDMDDLQGGFTDFTGMQGRSWLDSASPPGASRRPPRQRGGFGVPTRRGFAAPTSPRGEGLFAIWVRLLVPGLRPSSPTLRTRSPAQIASAAVRTRS